MVRNLAMAWVLTLPAAMFLSGSLYWLFSKLFWRKPEVPHEPEQARWKPGTGMPHACRYPS